ncbi:MAG: peptidoglycan-binding protein [Clostridia bacterium]|nr:peptidoglycan-binding protein [Clostridia bacterium]
MPTQRRNEQEAIRNLQRYLRQLSYVNDKIPPPPIDGIYDTRTQEAVRAFQQLEGLPVTGVVDTETWELLFLRYEESLEREGAPVPLAQFPRLSPGYALREGDESFLVRLIQYALGELETIYEDLDDVEETGVYDENTAQAVRNFQRRHNLPETGEVDRATWDAIANTYNREFGGYVSQ